jgi:G:T/U-mismatch repair DNA glycosylase
MRTTHKFLEKYPILMDSEKLIVGTIHPHDHEKFIIQFFYGNVISLWNILSDAFPEELKKPLTLEGILDFLSIRKISVSDTIKICDRQNPTALDKDLIPVKLNETIKEDIKKSNIKEILFTSGFGKNNAFRLFYTDILGLKITQEIKMNREIVVDEKIFGRPIKLTILYSPSGSSNVGLSKSKLFKENKEKYSKSKRPVYDFKVDYYRELFNKK